MLVFAWEVTYALTGSSTISWLSGKDMETHNYKLHGY